MNLIFLDLSLGAYGVYKGEDLIDTLHNQLPGVPIVVITGYRDEQLEARVKKREIARYLLKPLRGETCAKVIEEFLGIKTLPMH